MSSHKTVLKNTLFLYVRMFVTILVSLYTTRVVLATLGVTDFGIYNVIGGFVAMFSFLTVTMSNASTRFFSYELGKNDIKSQTSTFRVTFTIYLLLIAVILLLGETLGLWFVYNKLNIPTNRHTAAIIVYQFSLLALVFNILRIPFNAAIIAHERMNFYAYLSIIESFLKLGIVFLLVISPWDKLSFYAILFASVVLIITITYYIYASRNFKECRPGIDFSAEKFKEILGFSSWNLASNFGDVMMDQGLNILLNIFFGPTVNAARGIAYSVKGVVTNFVGNFQTAASPQITKHYAANELTQMDNLVIQTSKMSYFLMLVIVLPAFFCVKLLLGIWLTDVPHYTLIFTNLLLIEVLILAMGGTLNIAIQATGKINRFVISLSIIKLVNFILVYLGFILFKFPPEYALYICIFNSFCCMITKFHYYKKIIQKPWTDIINSVFKREFIVTTVSVVIILILSLFIYNPENIANVATMTVIAFAIVSGCIFRLGLDTDERHKITSLLRNKISK